MQEMWFRSLGQRNPLEEEMATHSGIPARESHGQRSLAGYSLRGHKELDTWLRDWAHTHGFKFSFNKTHLVYIPSTCSTVENVDLSVAWTAS